MKEEKSKDEKETLQMKLRPKRYLLNMEYENFVHIFNTVINPNYYPDTGLFFINYINIFVSLQPEELSL